MERYKEFILNRFLINSEVPVKFGEIVMPGNKGLRKKLISSNYSDQVIDNEFIEKANLENYS